MPSNAQRLAPSSSEPCAAEGRAQSQIALQIMGDSEPGLKESSVAAGGSTRTSAERSRGTGSEERELSGQREIATPEEVESKDYYESDFYNP